MIRDALGDETDSLVEELTEALKLADATLRGANMNLVVVERKVTDALAKVEKP